MLVPRQPVTNTAPSQRSVFRPPNFPQQPVPLTQLLIPSPSSVFVFFPQLLTPNVLIKLLLCPLSIFSHSLCPFYKIGAPRGLFATDSRRVRHSVYPQEAVVEGTNSQCHQRGDATVQGGARSQGSARGRCRVILFDHKTGSLPLRTAELSAHNNPSKLLPSPRFDQTLA